MRSYLYSDDTIVSGDSAVTVKDILTDKHPPGQSLIHSALLDPVSSAQTVHPVVFECIDANLIRHAAKLTDGAAGPSGIDAHGWRRMCCAFQSASNELCHSLALFAKRICTTHLHHSGLAPFLACRLIPLNKHTGVRPIGICEVVRRIVSKAILFVIKGDIQEAAGSCQLCGGQIAGTEATVYTCNEGLI